MARHADAPLGRAANSLAGRPRGVSLPDAERPTVFDWRPDAVTLATAFVVAVFLLPSRLVFAPLGAAGRPAVLIAVGMFLLWSFDRLLPRPPLTERRPLHVVMTLYLTAMLVTTTNGLLRGLDETELNGTIRALVITLGMAGVALVIAEGTPSLARLDDLVGRIVLGAAFMSAVGVLQFTTGFDLTRYLRPPGLVLNGELIGLSSRGTGFSRVAGTAGHYIEYGTVAALVLPLAVHRALVAPTRNSAHLRWGLVALIAIAVPFSISRTSVLALALIFVMLLSAWSPPVRVKALVASGVGVGLLAATVPGLLGSIKALFLHLDDDPSVSGRTSDYAIVAALVDERPWLGMGPGTFIPTRYIFLDNQYLGTLITSGSVGLVALIALMGTGFALARRVRRLGRTEETRHLGHSLAAVFLGIAVTSATFDSMAFATFAAVLFLALGLTAALHRLDRAPRGADTATGRLPGLR